MATNLISGLSSGFDWQGMIEQLIKIEHQRVDLVSNRKTEYENKLKEWQGVNTKLLALKTKATALALDSAFDVFTSSISSNTSTAASDLLSVTVGTSASAGSYNIKINNLAQSEKISSRSYSTSDTALGISGDILVSGKAINIVSTDTLANIKEKINTANTGSAPSNVTASIVQHSSTDYHLVLASDQTGKEGIDVLEASSDNVLRGMGFIDSTAGSIKNATSNGAQSDLFSDSNTAIGTLLELTNPQGAISVTIGGSAVSIDVSTQSITTIAANINAIGGGITASVVSETGDDDVTRYRIKINGTTSFTDTDNVLQTLGILEGNHGAVSEALTGSKANTTDGVTAISAATQWDQIFGANVQAGTSFTLSGRKHDGTEVSGSFTISGTGATVQELLSYIQTTLFGGSVTATIDTAGKIQVTDTATGDSQLELTLQTNNPAGGSLDFGTISMSTEGRSMQIAAGEDSEISLDNVIIHKSSNEISDVIPGVTLNLVGENTSTTVNFKVERDTAGIKSKIKSLADSYNEIMSYIQTQFSYDEKTKKTGGILFGDGTLSSVKSGLIDIITDTIAGLSTDYSRLPLIGISLDDESKLTIDDTKLTNALKTNLDAVKKLFAAAGTSPNSLLTYVGHTDSTQGGNYTVNVTQAATRTIVTGSAALAGTLGSDETVSITDFSTQRIATVSLTSGMSLDDIINAVNSEMGKSYTQQVQGSAATGFTSATALSAIAGAEVGDVITFSGSRSNGRAVSGTYKITDTSDTLADLLSQISDMFEGDATVSLNGSGQLTVTDKQAGDSNLSLSINTSAVSGLDFGSFSTITEGRYALPITASKNGSNQLILTHNSYGTGHAIVVSESGGTALGLTDSTQVYGLNVAGTINGAAATGMGQTLKLSSSGNDADGLSVLYTGTGAATTTLNLSLGVADLLERQLLFLTQTDGTVAFKQTSLQASIDSYESQIDQMEATLERKQESMTSRFVRMETALSKLQNQSSWLSSQITALQSSWT